MNILQQINKPSDIKTLTKVELNSLLDEIRNAILNRVSKIGGHVGPNLGMVEAIVALHYVFNSPKDKIVFDVSHQCYAHKILTGRKEYFLNDDKFHKISGYTSPNESKHDFFTVGHTSTSVSLASGLAKARDLKKETHNVIAVIGDGSLGGGEALEGLNFAGELNSNLIIVVNDNEMSIAPNHGGLYQNLKELRKTKGKSPINLFKSFGLEYVYLEEGNDIEKLISVFQQVKDNPKPIVVHIHTDKGHGYSFSEKEKEKWHYNMPFDIQTGESTFSFSGENYNSLTTEFLLQKAKKDEKVVVINAGTPGAIGFTPEIRDAFGSQFIDVGIAEEHAVAMTSALAKGGCKPVFMVLSSFVQRTYDQLSQDLALNKNPAVILVSWAGIGPNDATHLGTFDIPLISNIPNIVHLAPTSKEEYFAMLDWAIEQQDYPVVIRVPSFVVSDSKETVFTSLPKPQVTKKGEQVALLGLGSFYFLALKVAEELSKEGIEATIVNPIVMSDIDKELLNHLKKKHSVVVTLEDGVLSGGYGQKVASFYGASEMKVLNYGADKEFTDRESIEKLYNRYRLDEKKIVEDILTVLA